MSSQNTPKADTLSPRQAVYVAARRAATMVQAAKVAGVSERTAQRWEASAPVKTALRAQSAATLAESARLGAELVLVALHHLAALLASKDTPPSVRLAVCRVILSATPALLETHDLIERIEALEQRAKDEQTQSNTSPGRPRVAGRW